MSSYILGGLCCRLFNWTESHYDALVVKWFKKKSDIPSTCPILHPW